MGQGDRERAPEQKKSLQATMGGRQSRSKLPVEDMEFLVHNTRYDESTINEWYKGFKQDCPDGRLCKELFKKIYSKCFPAGNAEEFCAHVFRTFDSDNNGFIDFTEFLLAIDVTSAGSPEQKLNWAFRMYDVDGNGVIEIEEMSRIVHSIYAMMGPDQSLAERQMESAEQRAENIFKRMDINSDGKVEKREFVRCCMQDKKLIGLLTPQPLN